MADQPEIDSGLEDALHEALREIDIFLFTRKCKLKEARELLLGNYGIIATNKQISWVAQGACRYWRQRRRKRKSPTEYLTGKRWDQVMTYVDDETAEESEGSADWAIEMLYDYLAETYHHALSQLVDYSFDIAENTGGYVFSAASDLYSK